MLHKHAGLMIQRESHGETQKPCERICSAAIESSDTSECYDLTRTYKDSYALQEHKQAVTSALCALQYGIIVYYILFIGTSERGQSKLADLSD